LGAFGFIAVLAAVVVMAMTLPKTVREFCVAMISTTVSSICGGAFVVRWLGIGDWANDDVGLHCYRRCDLCVWFASMGIGSRLVQVG
jgi:vacuolar-type H+-ATPase subunit I/STV1